MVLQTVQGQFEFTRIANVSFEQGSTKNTGVPPGLHVDEEKVQLQVSIVQKFSHQDMHVSEDPGKRQ